MNKVGVIGAGAWGTALASVVRRAGADVLLYAHEKQTISSVNNSHVNKLFLPDIMLDKAIRATGKINQVLEADIVLIVVPAQHLRKICQVASKGWRVGTPAVICSKGIELDTGALMSEVVTDVLPGAPVAILSGPTFAREVAQDLPAAATLAYGNEKIGNQIMSIFTTRNFRVYRSRDVIGTQIGGAMKNVIAIACGIIEGKGLGASSKAAVVTRGLTEMIRFGLKKGAEKETLSGLSGIGDLALTCGDLQSRNFSLGVALGKGESLDNIIGKRISVAEGVSSALSVVTSAEKLGIDVPICNAVHSVIAGKATIDEVIERLLSRPLRKEID